MLFGEVFSRVCFGHLRVAPREALLRCGRTKSAAYRRKELVVTWEGVEQVYSGRTPNSMTW